MSALPFLYVWLFAAYLKQENDVESYVFINMWIIFFAPNLEKTQSFLYKNF